MGDVVKMRPGAGSPLVTDEDLDKREIDTAGCAAYANALYTVVSVVPLSDHPYTVTREHMTLDAMDALLDGYSEYAEFVVGVTREQ